MEELKKSKKLRSKKRVERTTNAVVYVILVIISIIWIIPYVYLIIQSLRAEPGAYINYLLPKEWTFDNYIKLFTDTSLFDFPRWYLNTFVTALVVCVIQTTIVLATSYALSRLRFKGRKGLMNLFLVLGMFPGFHVDDGGVLCPQGRSGLHRALLVSCSSMWQAVQCSITSASGYFDTIPKSLDEAA